MIQPEGWFRDPVILPRRFLERSDDAALFVVLNEDKLAALQAFMPTNKYGESHRSTAGSSDAEVLTSALV